MPLGKGSSPYHNLEFPQHLNVDVLPREICDTAIEKSGLMNTDRFSVTQKEQIARCVSKLKLEKTRNSCKEILEFSEIIDDATGLYLKDCIPDLYKQLKTHC